MTSVDQAWINVQEKVMDRITRMTMDMPSDNTDYMLHILSYGVIEKMRERIVELDGFIETGNEQQVAVENENGELRGIIQQAADDVVAASYPRTMHLEWLEAARKVLAKDD